MEFLDLRRRRERRYPLKKADTDIDR